MKIDFSKKDRPWLLGNVGQDGAEEWKAVFPLAMSDVPNVVRCVDRRAKQFLVPMENLREWPYPSGKKVLWKLREKSAHNRAAD